MLRELESLAGQHEVVAETLKKNISPQIMSKCAELRQTRKNQLAYLQKLNLDLTKAMEAMEKTHRSYAKAFKEAEAAHIKLDKDDKDLNLSRAAVEKSKNNVAYKNQLCDDAKKNYASALLIANDIKVKHFEVELPSLLEQMKAADVDRIKNTRLAMQKTIESETNILRIIQVCYDEMLKAVSNINPDSDTQIVVEQNVSGYPVPENYPFDDLGDPGQIVNPDSADSSSIKRGTLPLSTKNGSGKTSSIGRRQSMHQKFFGGGGSEKPKINGVQSDYGNLPPQQRCRKIQSKLDELSKEQETIQKSLDGVEKMAEVYKGNPKLGNPKDVEPKIVEYKAHLTSVNTDIVKYKSLMENIQNEMRQSGSDIGLRSPYNGHSSPSSNASPRISSSGYGSAANTNRTSYSEESVSSENSHGLSSRKITPVPVVNGNIPKPVINLQKEPSPIRPSPPAQNHETKSDTYEEFDLPVLGICTARYAFEGSSDGTTVAMKEGDEMLLLEKDAGDGWTRIRHKATQIEGFVPTSYLDCQWY
uniref:Uncharacterized protein n=1 Tax=Panagrolaimus superbus TaxID=310955 RepID=A0A914ZAB6_9BILA